MGKFDDYYFRVNSDVNQPQIRFVFLASSLLQRTNDDGQIYAALKEIFSDSLQKFLAEQDYTDDGGTGQKNDDFSIFHRTNGNKFFKDECYMDAFKSYNQSIALAPPNSECLALAYANRSAVLVRTRRPSEEVIEDIERATANGYPQKLIFKLHERKAQALQYEHRYSLAAQSYQDALTSLAHSEWDPKTKKAQDTKLMAQMLDCNMSSFTSLHFGLKLNNDAPKDIELLPTLSYRVNPELPSLSNCVTLSYNAELGRHFVAAKNIQPGDVLAIERSLASVVLPENFYTHCNYCAKRCVVLLPCNKCSWAMFCSDHCRSSGAQVHAFECPIVSTLLPWDIGELAFLIVRILATFGISEVHQFLLSKCQETSEEVDPRTCGMVNGQYSANLNAFYNLARAMKHRSASDLCKRYAMAFSLGHCLKELLPDQDLFQMFFVRAFQSLSINSWSVNETFKNYLGDDSSVNVGSAIAVACSFFSHSCSPNATHISYPEGWQIVRAIQPVKKGSVVSLVYGSTFWRSTSDDRQSFLKRRYFFHCLCEACVNDWPSFILNRVLNPSAPVTMIPKHFASKNEKKICEKALEEVKDLVSWLESGYETTEEQAKQIVKFLTTMWNIKATLCFSYTLFLESFENHMWREGLRSVSKFK